MFYALEVDFKNYKYLTSAKDRTILNFDEVMWVEFKTGVQFNLKTKLKLEFKLKKTKTIPDYFDVSGCVVVSERLKNCLEKYKVKVQFLKIDLIKNGNKSESDNYYMFNLLEKVDCIDMKASKVEMHTSPMHFRHVSKLIFLKDKKYPNAFIVDKYFIPAYFVSESFKEILEEEKFNGIRFVKLEDFMF